MSVDFVGVIDVDHQLRDLTMDPLVGVERRTLCALSIGIEARLAVSECGELLEVLCALQADLAARVRLASLLERPDGHYLRSIYFAQAGRGIGLAIGNLEWLLRLLSARAEFSTWAEQRSLARLPMRRSLNSWLFDLQLIVDRSSMTCGPSLGAVERREMPVCGYDFGLIDVSLKQGVGPLLRAVAGLSVGIGIDDAHYCVVGVLKAVDQLRMSKGRNTALAGEILSGPFDDYQRALFFACVGRSWIDVYFALGTLRELCEERIAAWKDNQEAGIDVGRRVSPYLGIGAPEACLFVDLNAQAARYSA